MCFALFFGVILVCSCICIHCDNSSKGSEVLSASNKLAEHHEVDKAAAAMNVPTTELSSNAIVNETYEEEVTIFGYAVVDIKDVRTNISDVTYLCL